MHHDRRLCISPRPLTQGEKGLHLLASSSSSPCTTSPSNSSSCLFVAAFLAGFIDSIAGGGGMITIPAMLIAGIPPLETLGTNKLQSLFGSGSATLCLCPAGHVDLRRQLPMALMSALGAALGRAARHRRSRRRSEERSCPSC